MRLKYIIASVLALAGILFGVWNWMQYFSNNVSAPAAELQSVRPPSREEQQFQDGISSPAAAPDTGRTSPAGLAVHRREFPSSPARNPFLTLEEENALARGEIIEIFPDEAVDERADMNGLPAIEVKGLIQDNLSGRYRAIINGKYYSAGDMLGEEKIVEISSNALVLESGERRRTIGIGRARDVSNGIRMHRTP